MSLEYILQYHSDFKRTKNIENNSFYSTRWNKFAPDEKWLKTNATTPPHTHCQTGTERVPLESYHLYFRVASLPLSYFLRCQKIHFGIRFRFSRQFFLKVWSNAVCKKFSREYTPVFYSKQDIKLFIEYQSLEDSSSIQFIGSK